jgi:hypothetical protein
MSYVRYNENLYRTGFRPYGQTDPFAASQLSGIRTPFDPAKLHGAPFTRGGGWALHGLGASYDASDQTVMLRAGQQYTIELATSGAILAPGASDIAAALQAIPQFGGSAQVSSALLGSGISITFTLSTNTFAWLLQTEVMGSLDELYAGTINWLGLHDGGPSSTAGIPWWAWAGIGVAAILFIQR